MGPGGKAAARDPGATRTGLLLALALAAGACATGGPRLVDGRYVFAPASFSVAPPPGEGERWTRVEVPGAALAFRGRSGSPAGGATLSMLERCEVPIAEPRLLARHLLIGLEERSAQRGEPVVVDGAPGWRQAVRAVSEGRAVELRTVTRVAGRCTTDFVLVAPRVDGGLESDFDAFWASYRAGAAGARG